LSGAALWVVVSQAAFSRASRNTTARWVNQLK
jgi:hypothetical protein